MISPRPKAATVLPQSPLSYTLRTDKSHHQLASQLCNLINEDTLHVQSFRIPVRFHTRRRIGLLLHPRGIQGVERDVDGRHLRTLLHLAILTFAYMHDSASSVLLDIDGFRGNCCFRFLLSTSCCSCVIRLTTKADILLGCDADG